MGPQHTVDKGHSRAVRTTFTNPLQVSSQEVSTADFQALLDHLRSELINAVFGCIAQDMFDGPATISWRSMLANVLDAPIAELPVSDDVDVVKNFIDTRALLQRSASTNFTMHDCVPCPLQDNSQRCFGQPSSQSLQAQPRATFPEGLR